MNKLIRRIRTYFTVAYARRQYRRAKDIADRKREGTKTHWHVVIDPFNDRGLVVIDRSLFRDFKRKYQDSAIRTLVRRGSKYTVVATTDMEQMKSGAFYSTSLTDPIDIEARRRAYIDWVVKLSEKKGGKR